MAINYSIVIPYKNIKDLLLRCLHSMPRREDVEVIVVDDGSDPKNACTGSSFVKVIKTEAGKGAGAARNLGLREAKGKWVLFVDADDYFSSDVLEILDAHLQSESDIVFFNVECVNSDTLDVVHDTRSKRNFFEKKYRSEKQKERRFRYTYTEPWGKMYRRSMLNERGIWFDEVPVCNDFMFSVKSGHYAKKIDFDSRVLYYNTIRVNSICTSSYLKTETDVFERVKVSSDVYLFCKSNDIDYKIMPQNLFWLCSIVRESFEGIYADVERYLEKKGLSKKDLVLGEIKYKLFVGYLNLRGTLKSKLLSLFR